MTEGGTRRGTTTDVGWRSQCKGRKLLGPSLTYIYMYIYTYTTSIDIYI
jgi:hypothetical protein